MRAYLLGYSHGKDDGYFSTLIERGGCEKSYDESLDVEYVAIDEVLEIIDAQVCCGRLNANDFRTAVLALKGEQE